MKAANLGLDRDYLESRAQAVIAKGYQKQKWVEFCEAMMDLGYELTLYEARRTVSKYITVHNKPKRKTFTVRFSNHRPIRYREEAGDCDFFAGVTNHTVTTTAQAIKAAKDFLA